MSSSQQRKTPLADLHTPEELLDGAEVLFSFGNPKMMRGVVLEAITALEAYVQAIVFSALKSKIDPALVEWLEKKTRMDFDSRLSVLTPVAIGRPIDKQSRLWQDYKKAKEIRNRVTHSGRKVASSEARFVIDTVYNWLAYLGSTVELEVALIGLKRYIEEKAPIEINTETDAISIILDYFGRTKAAEALVEEAFQVGARAIQVRPDIVLGFGQYRVLVETKFSHKGYTQMVVESAIEQVSAFMAATGLVQSAIIVFQKGEVQPGFESVRKYQDGQVYVVVIKV